MKTSYELIYSNILSKIKSYKIAHLESEEQIKEYLHDYLIIAISKFYICKKDLSKRNDELEYFEDELSEMEINILGNYAIIEYLDSTYIRTPTLLKTSLSSKDFNAFSSANMLDKLVEMQKYYISENEALLMRYSWLCDIDQSNLSLKSNYKRKIY